MKSKKDTLLKRLQEIRNTVLEELSDDQVLQLLAERKRMSQELDALERDQENRRHLKHEHDVVEEKIDDLNKEITPQKGDEELLGLIKERQSLEEELLRIERELEAPLVTEAALAGEALPEAISSQAASLPTPEAVLASEPEEARTPAAPDGEPRVAPLPEAGQAPPEAEPESLPEEAPASGEGEPGAAPLVVASEQTAELQPESGSAVPEEEPTKSPMFKEEGFGKEGIKGLTADEGNRFARFLPQLEASRENLSNFLRDLPREARGDKPFMLKVAAVDPAYAMHYASEELKRDPDFNLDVASIRTTRQSGNPLAEMLPEMRTGPVVLAAIRQDFRNVRFAAPSMPEYAEIILSAKKGALEKMQSLQHAADATFLIPKVLQKDAAFMQEVRRSIGK